MTSVEDFVRWGKPVLEGLFREFDGEVTHLHVNGRHLLAGVAQVRGRCAAMLYDERDLPPAFDELADLRRRAGATPLLCAVPVRRFREGLASGGLVGGVLSFVEGVPDAEQANDMMEQVRSFRGRPGPAPGVV